MSAERNLPDFNRLVVARLVGANHHTGDHIAWHREGWAFMVRWDDSPEHTIADGWARDRYEKALKEIDADYAEVVEWIYVHKLSDVSQSVLS